MDLNIQDGQISLGGKVYPVNPKVKTPEVTGTARDPLSGRDVGITRTGKECLEYIKAALNVQDVILEPGTVPWATEYMCTSVSIVLEGLQLGSLLVNEP